jgi:hypothetical protein
MSDITQALELSPRHAGLLSEAAHYYYMNNLDPQQVLKWINTALTLEEERWLHRQKVEILERMKNYPEARKAARTAIAFLRKTKPEAWEIDTVEYEERMKKWPGK